MKIEEKKIFKNIFYKKKKKILIFSLISLFIFIFWWTQPHFDESGSIKIWDKNSILLYESVGDSGRKIPITYDRFPQHLINAVVASEDITFWTNPGIDFRAIARSLYINVKERRIVSGASTITQQLARASIISPRKQPNRSIIRKIREAIIALRLTISFSKKDILTRYLNQMYFGNLSYGVQAASLTFFNKDVSQLSLAESALLVGLLSSPDRRNPFTNIDEAKKEQSQVLDLMVKNGFIDKEKAIEAKQEVLSFVKKNTIIKAPHFVMYVLKELGALGVENKRGLNVYTTLDYPTFDLSEKIARIWVDRLKEKHGLSNAALVLIKNETGEIVNMLGGIDYFDDTNSGQVNMAVALRQPGSTLKPITYAAAFMHGYTPATLIYDVKKIYKTKKGEGYTPNNYDGRFNGLVLAREAMASSLNLPAVEMLNRIGIPTFIKLAKDMGITTFNQEDRYDLSLTLGGGEVRLLELTNVFASFARGGEFLETFSIQKIITDDGQFLYEHPIKQGKQTLGDKGKQIAYLISNILSDPKARIRGFSEKNSLVLSHPAAVKTGTTTDWHDNWTVGYTPRYTVGVWVGNNNNHPMKEITGVVGAAPIWNQFFEEFLKGNPAEQFIRPDGIKAVEVCALSGDLPDELCPEKTIEVFIEGTEPKDISKLHKKVHIDIRNGLLASDSCPNRFVEEKVFVDYPPEVYSWAIKENIEVAPQKASPLCSTDIRSSGNLYVEIIYPKPKTIFETAPLIVNNEVIVFEANVSQNIKRVVWYLNGKHLKETTVFPFSAAWKPQVGKHTITAFGISTDNMKVKSEDINFSVVEFKENDIR